MTFISYAQNFEDVMLWRALKRIKRGFYVDVGANDPDLDSVTKAFYERGWRGINVEPVPEWAEKLREKRPEDVNLQVAAAAETGELMLYELPGTGLSTSRISIATRGAAVHGMQLVERLVRADTLTAICSRVGVTPIHFLKIDVEGAERDVLEGLDLSIIRPWIILVESTLPLTQDESFADWEPILRRGNYQFAYFDGLNRFYVASERADLLATFDRPPSVFDEFVPAAQVAAEAASQAARGDAAAAARTVRRLKVRIAKAEMREAAAAAALEAATAATVAAERRAEEQSMRASAAEELAHRHALRAADAEQQARALVDSRCWRYTAPVRWVVDGLRRRREPALAAPGSSIPAGADLLTPKARIIHARLSRSVARQQKRR
jgi:FkbM family methyltransferase